MSSVCEAADNSEPYVVTPFGVFKTIDFIFLDFLAPYYFTIAEQLFGRKVEKMSIHGSADNLVSSK